MDNPSIRSVEALMDNPVVYVGGEDLEHWRRLLVAQRALSYPVGFASARVPSDYADLLAAEFHEQGFTVRVSEPFSGCSGEERRVVTLWLRQPGPQKEQD